MTKTSWIMAATLLSTLLTLSVTVAPAFSQSKKTPRPAPALKVGDEAPDFKMQYFDGHDLKNVSLSDYRGKKNVVLAFYVFAFTGG
jgi:peroxiredoxin